MFSAWLVVTEKLILLPRLLLFCCVMEGSLPRSQRQTAGRGRSVHGPSDIHHHQSSKSLPGAPPTDWGRGYGWGSGKEHLGTVQDIVRCLEEQAGIDLIWRGTEVEFLGWGGLCVGVALQVFLSCQGIVLWFPRAQFSQHGNEGTFQSLSHSVKGKFAGGRRLVWNSVGGPL